MGRLLENFSAGMGAICTDQNYAKLPFLVRDAIGPLEVGDHGISEDDIAIAHLATGAVSGMLASRAISAYMRLIEVAESPIERAFAAAFWTLAFSRFDTGCSLLSVVHEGIRLDVPGGNDGTSMTIEPQAQIGKYRVDFRISRKSVVPMGFKDDGSVKEREDMRVLIVECDGHDFHERTKEQAAKDKSRDRVLQAAGYHVYRFTGSEIWNDPIACAKQVLDVVARYGDE